MRIRLRHCRWCDRDHAASLRQYAHAGHRPATVCVASAFFSLPEEHQLGLLAHELGHISLLPAPHTEEMADKIAGLIFGVTIRYKDSPYGEHLQYLSKTDQAKMRKAIGRE